MSFDFSSLTGSKSLPNKGTLKDFIFEIAGQGYNIYKKNGLENPIHLGKNARKQMLFKNKEGKELLLYISRQLDEQLSAIKIKREELENCLVYVLDRDGHSEFVLGINSSFETIDTKNFTDEDWSNLFSTENYIKSRIRK
jgi:hypothetical protein